MLLKTSWQWILWNIDIFYSNALLSMSCLAYFHRPSFPSMPFKNQRECVWACCVQYFEKKTNKKNPIGHISKCTKTFFISSMTPMLDSFEMKSSAARRDVARQLRDLASAVVPSFSQQQQQALWVLMQCAHIKWMIHRSRCRYLQYLWEQIVFSPLPLWFKSFRCACQYGWLSLCHIANICRLQQNVK